MRLSIPPPDIPLAPRQENATLLRALALAMSALERQDRDLARALELGDIDLPPSAPTAQDRAQLDAAAPLYFASELEAAGLLATADLIAGLFASGTITQPLGPIATTIHAFWRARRERLAANERAAIFARVVEQPYFDRLMSTLCAAIAAQSDATPATTLSRSQGLHEDVRLATALRDIGEFLAQRVDPMAAMSAKEIVGNINTALAFLRDRLLQVAFGVNSLWALLASTGTAGDAATVRAHADRGGAGQTVLLWVARHASDTQPRLDPARADDVAIIEAAQRWTASAVRPALVAVA
jgi:hypothetical protein